MKKLVCRSRKRALGVLTVAAACLVSVAAVGATASNGPPAIAAGPAFGYVPAQNPNAELAPGPVPSDNANANAQKPKGHVNLLQYHGGAVRTSGTDVYPVYWGTTWSGSYSATAAGLQTFYQGVGGTGYAKTNTEYTNGSNVHVSSAVTWKSNLFDNTSTPSGAPSTSQVLAEVAKATGNNPVSGAYYPVYSDQPRGNAGYCAWHSAGSINGIPVQIGFFFSLAGDNGCDPQDTSGNHTQQLAALGNVSGHELSEMMTDPQLNAWYDQQGNENADKCAWTFSGLVTFSNNSIWKIQGNWSNAAANTNSGYGSTVGCIETSSSGY